MTTSRRVLWLACLCSLLAVTITRWPYRSHALFSWDSANFALAVDRIDIAAHRPHPPGYLGYVFAARALRPLTGSVNGALVVWNLLVTILAAALVALFAWEVNEGPRRAWAAAAAWAVLVTSPLLWFYGEIAEIYPSELFVSLLVAYAASRALRGRPHALEWCAAAIAVAVLFKMTAAVFLLPLIGYAWTASPARGTRRPAAILAAAMAAVGLLFLFVEPRLVQVTWSQFATATSGSRLVEGAASSRLRSFNANARDTLTAALAALGVVNFAALVAWAAIDRRLPRSLDWRMAMLWVGPWLMFLVFIHIGRPGYVLPLLPMASMIVGAFYARRHPAIAAAFIALQAIANAAQFRALTPFSEAATGGTASYRSKSMLQRAASDLQPLTFPTRFTIADSDARVGRLQQFVADRCPGGDLVVVAGAGPIDWRRVMWYLPEATSIYVDDAKPALVARHTDFSPVPAEGLTLHPPCPTLWIVSDAGTPSMPAFARTATAHPGLGWTTPPGTVSVSTSSVTVTR